MHNGRLSLVLAQASAQAYTDDMTGVIASYSGSVARAIVKQYDDALIVAFRGTEPDHLRDWMADLDIVQRSAVVYGVHCLVHAGFAESLAQVKSQLDGFLAKAAPKILYITGHSLGGAMACLYAAERQVDALYTYGQPRTGNGDFATAANEAIPNYYRIVNDIDLVPRMPEGLGYAHAGTLVLLGADGKLSMPTAMPAESLNLVADIDDHMMTAYLPKLQALCN